MLILFKKFDFYFNCCNIINNYLFLAFFLFKFYTEGHVNLKNNLFLYLIILGYFGTAIVIKTSLVRSHQTLPKLPYEIIHLISAFADDKTAASLLLTSNTLKNFLQTNNFTEQALNVRRLTFCCLSLLEKNLQNNDYKQDKFWKFCQKNGAPSSIKNLKIDEILYNPELSNRFLKFSSLSHDPIDGYLIHRYHPISICTKKINFIMENKQENDTNLMLDKKTFDIILFFDKNKNTAISCNTKIQDSKELAKFIENVDRCFAENNIVRIAFQKNNFKEQPELIDENTIPLLIKKNIGCWGSSSFLLHDLAFGGHKEKLELILKTGINPNEKTLAKQSPLHSACSTNQFECAKLLLQYGVNKNFQNCYGDTPLHISVEQGNFEIIKLLLNQNVDLNIVNNHNETPLLCACRYGYLSIAHLLVAKGAHLWVNKKPIYQLINQNKFPELYDFILDETIKACLK